MSIAISVEVFHWYVKYYILPGTEEENSTYFHHHIVPGDSVCLDAVYTFIFIVDSVQHFAPHSSIELERK